MNMSEGEKSAYIVRHIFVNIFSLWNFCEPFLTDPKSASNYAFFDTHITFFQILNHTGI